MNETKPEIESDDDSSRKMDPEIRTIGRIIKLLDDVEEQGRSRVVAYLASRYATVK